MMTVERTVEKINTTVGKLPRTVRLRATAAMIGGWTRMRMARSAYESWLTGCPPEGAGQWVPYYGRDIAAVFRDLVPAMRERGYSLYLNNEEAAPQWLAWFTAGDNDDDGAAVMDENPAAAICRAAARALGIDTSVSRPS